ncbi:hypothetical protein SADUNF_Sadunf08G0036400 [Salix dunnii]|uniref:Uncharacterized protein n=1 Tax=Salix dunnii TaxID=1413687 RepID=A0A835MT93_9ROSI|nr:hypothetical protein SADUNF_Sadunf08G0036400 [Salix dunnii]
MALKETDITKEKLITLLPVASSTNNKADSPRIAIRPFTLSLYGLNPNSTFNPSETDFFKGTGGRYIPDPDPAPDFPFFAFRSSAFLPVPLLYRSRTWDSRLSNWSSGADPGFDSGSWVASALLSSVVARVMKGSLGERCRPSMVDALQPKHLAQQACRSLKQKGPICDDQGNLSTNPKNPRRKDFIACETRL